MEYSSGSSKERKSTVCILLNYIENNGNAWDLTLKAIDESVQLLKTNEYLPSLLDRRSLNQDLCEAMTKTNFLQQVKNLAELTADMHIALSSQPINEDFQIIKSIQSNCVEEAKTTFEEIKASRNLNKNNVLLKELLSKETEMMGFLKNNFPQEPSLKLIHPHGDYHLGQILFSEANDFTIIDFEGEPGKKKINSDCQENTVHSGQTGLALEDVAGMLRSFSYAINFYQIQNPHSAELINQIKNEWYKTVSKEFMESYFHKTASCNFIPQDKEKRERLLKCLILRKALYEVKYELNNRPDWLFIPINGALELIKNDF
jgi:maltose alpha-D-glucosyltransferase/alpha-amylase